MPRLPVSVQPFDADEMREFFDNIGQVALVAIHAHRDRDVKGQWFGADADAAVSWAQARNSDGYGIYFVANNLPNGWRSNAQNNKPSNEDIVSCRMVHVDIDPPRSIRQEDTSEFKASTLRTLENLRCPPTIALDTGGGLAAYWFLDDPCENKDAITEINQQARTMFNADACHDVSRVMRVPGSLNIPNRVKEAKGRKPQMARILMPFSGQLYSPEELRAFFPPAEHGKSADVERAKVALGTVEFTTCEDMGLTPFNPLRKAVERPAGSDRSANALHAACEAVRYGLDDEAIAGLLLNPANPVSGHILDQPDPMRALRRVIGRARGEEPDAQVVPQETREAVAALAQTEAAKAPVKKTAEPLQVAPDVQTKPQNPAWYGMLTPGLKMIVDTVIAGSPKPRLELALGSALSLVATAAGRRYRSPTGLLTNIYITALMPSGGGKDFPLRAPAKVLALAQLDQMIGGRIVSAMGVRSALEKYPVQFVPIDEMGKLLSAMANPRGTLKDAVSMLLELYSEAQGFAKGGMYSNTKERQTSVIHNPCLSFFGVATPSTFWEGLTSAAVSDGFLPRMILLTDNEPRTKTRHDLDLVHFSDALVSHIKQIASGAAADGHITFPLGDGSLMMPSPYKVPYGRGAKDAWVSIVDEADDCYDSKPEAVHAFYNRLAENATKLALVRAIDRCPQSPVLEVSDFEFGGMLARRSVDAFERQVGESLADNEYHAKLKRVMDVIARAGAEGVSTSEIGRVCQAIAKKEREAILEDLQEQERVTAWQVETGGRKRWMYREA